jgi:hypothetical protein
MPAQDPRVSALVERIHATPELLVYEFTGAGSLALFWLHSVGGSSRTVLEATDRYARASLSELLCGEPEKSVSRETALRMAERAYARAVTLAPGARCLGVSCTAAIATDRSRRGQDHCAVAVWEAQRQTSYALVLQKGARDRLGEEAVVSQLVLRAIALACGVADQAPLDLLEGEEVEEARG